MSIARGARCIAAFCTVALVVLAVFAFVNVFMEEGLILSNIAAFQKEKSTSKDVLRNRKHDECGKYGKKQEKRGCIGRKQTCTCSVENVCVPSPEEYLLGIVAHTAARRSTAIPLGKESKQMDLVSMASSRMFGKEGESAVLKSWEVFLLSHSYRTSSLAHALMTEISLQFRLCDSLRSEIRGIAEKEIKRRRKKLVEIRKKWPCITSRKWFEEHCVRPGVFCTWEFMEKHLLSGLPQEDSKNDEVFYKTWVYAFDLPAYLRSFIMFINRCCEDIWCDLDVVSGIAELMGSHYLEKQEMCIPGYSTCEAVTVPSQESVDLICGKMTRIYMDAILRRIDLHMLFDNTQP